jgi:hypothetical protein
MPKRANNYRLVKKHRNYSVEEIACLLSIHKNTVRAWVKNGLPRIDEIRPWVILGSELVTFLKARKTKRKQPCKPNELYCVRCRLPKVPAGGMADCLILSEKIGRLTALCPDCFCMMNRQVSMAKLALIEAQFSIRFTEAQERIKQENTTYRKQ